MPDDTQVLPQGYLLPLKFHLELVLQVPLLTDLSCLGVDRLDRGSGIENHAALKRVDAGLERAPSSPGIVHGELAPDVGSIHSDRLLGMRKSTSPQPR
jgi:hypothetical protein